MKISKMLTELLVTFIVATLLSVLLSVGLAFIAANLNTGADGQTYAGIIGSIFFGLIVGYKLHELVRVYKSKKK